VNEGDSAEAFRAEAAAYCRLIESAREFDLPSFVEECKTSLATLYLVVRRLPDVFEDSASEGGVGHAEWREIYERLSEMFGQDRQYWTVFDPTADEDPILGDLADDLGDIYRDLETGLRALDAGISPQAVVFDWRYGFRDHWGRHLTEALRALEARFPEP
jgi:hypothetical protein